MDDLYEDDESWNLFIRQYYWVLVLLVILAFIFVGLLLWYIRYCRSSANHPGAELCPLFCNLTIRNVKSSAGILSKSGRSHSKMQNRREPRYDYTALADESFLQERLEMDRKLIKDSDRNMATICCQYYLRGSNRYVFLQHLPDMGSRVGKNWYLVRDTATKTERLLTMTPVTETCPIRNNPQTSQVLLELFLAIQHPYIYPVLDIDRKMIMDQEYVIAVLPFNEEGTLKDIIYQSRCQDDWKDKYHYHGYGLNSSQIQRLGCQILEALLFLKDQKFPYFLHLHSGNVIVQNGVARIAGLENTLFGYSSRLMTLVPKRLHDNKDAIEVISFGQLIFEMASGYELTMSHPTEKNYQDIEHSPLVVDVLKFIFEQGRYRYPSLRQVASLEFFRHIDLRELRSLVPVPSIKAKLSSAALSLLKDVKRSQRSRRHGKYSRSVPSVDTASVDSRYSHSSEGSSNREKTMTVANAHCCAQSAILPGHAPNANNNVQGQVHTVLQLKHRLSKKKKKSSSDNPKLVDDQYSGQLLKTLPLSEAETSTLSEKNVEEFNETVQREQGDDLMQARCLLFQDIKRGVQLKRTSTDNDPSIV